jgi:expansin (peptidoglycan-binding protein)
MIIHRFAIASLIAVTGVVAAGMWAPLAAQSTPQDTAGTALTVAPIVAAQPIASMPPVQLVNGGSIDRGLLSTHARVSGPSDAHQLVPTEPVFRAAESSSSAANKTMMIVGGAGLIVGAVVGGTPGAVVMVGGTVVALVGLWNYLK